MPHGSLSIPARLCLLAWDSMEVTGTVRLNSLVRAGALVELAQRGLLTDEDGIATPADLDSDTGDPVLDGLLELVRESRPHRWHSWVSLRARITLDAVREQLAAGGYLRAEKRRVLGVFPTVEYALARVAVVQELRTQARAALRGPMPVAEISERDAALAALADAAGLLPPDSRPAPGRVEQLTERVGEAAAVLRTVVREVRTAKATAVAS
ncbi:GOLPH3/VPS74 family protein [Streptomyces cellulosae]|uniref:GOLPH3/VPS74 family protein n=1 Tax=Streptomyces cellulosae TaxID=1968 RepID=UPI0004C5A3AA|nr:GPP34 family phosphoprotein [Streptomyces cellulosae]